MIADLENQFAASDRLLSAFRDFVWDLRLQEEPVANRERAAAYETRRAFRRVWGEAEIKPVPTRFRSPYSLKPLMASEIHRLAGFK